ncbi:MAG: hypothetical protein NTY22_00240, partial [Proteobacteria bacterium]|nr:hypothetical protein [Pseudomonadota bacterium]
MPNNLLTKINAASNVKSITIPVMALYILKNQNPKTRLIIFPEQENALKLYEAVKAFTPNSNNFI